MEIIGEALTFDDLLLVPAHSSVHPKAVDLKTQLTARIQLNIPLLSAAMDTVSESRLAIAIAQEGGMAFLHKNMSIEAQANEVRLVKSYESGIVKDPITVSPNTTIDELVKLANAYNFSGMPVVEGDQLVGIITNRDFRFATDLSQPVSALMTQKSNLVTALEGAERTHVQKLLHKNRIEKVLLVDDAFRLKGMVTVKDILKAQEKPNACKDSAGQLRVGAAVGVGEIEFNRVSALVAAGVDAIVVDTAHGHSQSVINQVQQIRKTYPDLQMIAGNIATGEAALDLVKAGVNAVKVGIGPGSICTTRIVAGIGIPQVTAISNVAKALIGKNIPIIADGGIRFSGDIGKAIAAGASSVMIGGLLAGTEEAPGEVELYQGRSYKSYRGMGSVGAMDQTHGSSDRYFQDATNKGKKLVPEGVEGRVPYKGSLMNVIHQLMGGLRSAMGYTGSADVNTLRTSAKFVRVTGAGMKESHVHDVLITKEAPNYQVEEK